MRQQSGLFFVVILAGCASGDSRSDSVPPRPPAAISVIPAAGLQAQQLGPGECGMFLWSKTDPSKLVFFERGVSGKALLRLNNHTSELTRVRLAGDVFGQFTTDTYYMSGGTEVRLQFEPGEELIDGQRIRNGLITQTPPGAWQVKLPVLGVRACMKE